MLRQAANEDYSGLLLTALCPGIARRVYPFLANRTVETIINFIQVCCWIANHSKGLCRTFCPSEFTIYPSPLSPSHSRLMWC